MTTSGHRVGTAGMLSALSVRNIVLIDQLDLALDEGLTVLTGETGAGKSILLDALTLALGGRGDASLVRAGQRQRAGGRGACSLPRDHPARAALRENDVADDDEIILRRVQFADGRTRAFVNDQPVSAGPAADRRLADRRDPRPARRPRAGRCRDAPRAARCLRRARAVGGRRARRRTRRWSRPTRRSRRSGR